MNNNIQGLITKADLNTNEGNKRSEYMMRVFMWLWKYDYHDVTSYQKKHHVDVLPIELPLQTMDRMTLRFTGGGSNAGDGCSLRSWRSLPAAEQLSPSATTTEPVALEPTCPRGHALQPEKLLQWEACAPELDCSPCSLILGGKSPHTSEDSAQPKIKFIWRNRLISKKISKISCCHVFFEVFK